MKNGRQHCLKCEGKKLAIITAISKGKAALNKMKLSYVATVISIHS